MNELKIRKIVAGFFVLGQEVEQQSADNHRMTHVRFPLLRTRTVR